MKPLLKILLISVSLYACNSMNNDNARNDRDSSNVTLPPDSILNDGKSSNAVDPEEVKKETTRQAMAALLDSKKEMNALENEISEALTKSGVDDDKKLLYQRTIDQLEASSRMVNQQIEQIIVTDLQASRGKLTDIIQRMKTSQLGLDSMIARLDKITNYMQKATTLLQTLVPVIGPAKSHSKDQER